MTDESTHIVASFVAALHVLEILSVLWEVLTGDVIYIQFVRCRQAKPPVWYFDDCMTHMLVEHKSPQ